MNAPHFMNEILFNQKNFLNKQEHFSFDRLQPYILTPENWEIFKNSVVKVVVEPSTEKPMTEKPATEKPFIKPAQRFKTNLKDSIFWCIYVAVNGETIYQTQIQKGVNMVNFMMNEKKTMSDHFNKNPALLKNSNQKITLAKINEIKCNLMTKSYMDTVESFIPCSIYYGKPIYVVFEEINSYMKFVDKNYISDDEQDDPNVIILYANGGRFTLEPNRKDLNRQQFKSLSVMNQEEYKSADSGGDKIADHSRIEFLAGLNKIQSKMFYIQHYEKPLSGVSNYKTEELKEIYKIIFTEDVTMKKPEYYEKIVVKCSAIINEKIR